MKQIAISSCVISAAAFVGLLMSSSHAEASSATAAFRAMKDALKQAGAYTVTLIKTNEGPVSVLKIVGSHGETALPAGSQILTTKDGRVLNAKVVLDFDEKHYDAVVFGGSDTLELTPTGAHWKLVKIKFDPKSHRPQKYLILSSSKGKWSATKEYEFKYKK